MVTLAYYLGKLKGIREVDEGENTSGVEIGGNRSERCKSH